MQECERLQSDPVPGISAIPHENNVRQFDVIIDGPLQSPYESCSFALSQIDGAFSLEMYLPEEYPMSPPKVRFLTRVYHPNIDRLGRICLDILKGTRPPQLQRLFLDKWSPALQIRTVLLSIQALLASPNPDDPLANDVAAAWKANEETAIGTG